MTITEIRFMLLCALLSARVLAFPILPETELELMLKVGGVDPRDLESVMSAARAPSAATRLVACQFLSYRAGERVLAVLKERLQDSEPRVRFAAAQSLLAMGDRSGVEQMLKDWRELVPNEAERDPARMSDIEPYKFTLALEVGFVLVQAGDARALPLAAFAAGNGPPSKRSRAIDVLAKGLSVDEAELRKWGVDPGSVLQRLSASEREFVVVSTIWSRMELAPPPKAIPILKALADSPRLAELSRSAVQSVLRRKEAEARGEVPASRPASRPATVVIEQRPR